jgi:hypothetical protein
VHVPGLERPTDRRGRCALLAADVHRQSVRTGEDADDTGITGQPAGSLGSDRPGEGQLPTGDARSGTLGAQRHQIDGDPDLRRLATHRRQVARSQRVAGELDQRVPHPLTMGAEVARRPVGVHQRLEGGMHRFSTHGVEVPAQVDAAVGADRHPQHPRHPRRVVERPVGIDAGHPPADGLGGVFRAQR